MTVSHPFLEQVFLSTRTSHHFILLTIILRSHPNVFLSLPPPPHSGPRTLALKGEIASAMEASAITLVADMDKSKGNFFVDADGNSYLDCFSQIASLPLGSLRCWPSTFDALDDISIFSGYNHPRLLQAVSRPENLSLLVNRSANGEYGLTAPKHFF